MASTNAVKTTIVLIDQAKIGTFVATKPSQSLLEDWHLQPPQDLSHWERLSTAAAQIRDSDIPVAFPTETVYGLGADATRSPAVQGIYKAKQRPADNPLIVHFASLQHIRAIFGSSGEDGKEDPIPAIYWPLIQRFWPGPLTILLPLPDPSPLAPEATAGLATFGARIPRNALALALIHLSDRPIAAPSANASTRPSPTAAEHVKEDLDGRISTIIDGGPCDIGVESTVVDGLSITPAILRPGGVSLEEIKRCPGWEDCVIGYKDRSEMNGSGPRAPGMKYRHYSPKARVILYEAGAPAPDLDAFRHDSVGVIRTTVWQPDYGSRNGLGAVSNTANGKIDDGGGNKRRSAPLAEAEDSARFLPVYELQPLPVPQMHTFKYESAESQGGSLTVWDIGLGPQLDRVARGLFYALRELDRKLVDVILVEGVDECRGDVASAIMNRLRKASEEKVSAT